MSYKRSGIATAAIALSLCFASLSVAETPSPGRDSAGEQELRAVFLLNFARFITWPAEQPDDATPIVFAVAGDPNFAATLNKVVAGQTVRGRRLVVLPLNDLASLPAVHVIYFASAKEKPVSNWLAENAGSAILTVSGDKDFCRLGGMIYLYPEEHRMRFEINQKPLHRSGLRASSRLLALARSEAPTR